MLLRHLESKNRQKVFQRQNIFHWCRFGSSDVARPLSYKTKTTYSRLRSVRTRPRPHFQD